MPNNVIGKRVTHPPTLYIFKLSFFNQNAFILIILPNQALVFPIAYLII